jgi:hypothetical protein
MEHFLEQEDQLGQHSSSDESLDLFEPLDYDTDEVGLCPSDLLQLPLFVVVKRLN